MLTRCRGYGRESAVTLALVNRRLDPEPPVPAVWGTAAPAHRCDELMEDEQPDDRHE